MYGQGFQSPGQLAAVDAGCARIGLRPGMRVLDIGSGVGGPAFHLAERYGVAVLGLDVAPAMVELSRERLAATGLTGVSFELGDVREYPLPERSFDVAWSRDAIMYVADKDAVWRPVLGALKPGGRLYVTDFCLGPAPASPAFREYLAAAGYHLESVAAYAERLGRCGFVAVDARDETEAFERSLDDELERLARVKSDFMAEFSAEDYDYLVDRWRKKIGFCHRGELAWGVFAAERVAPPG